MAFIVFTTQQYELDRRELVDSVVIGRASECDVAIRDILLSRTHCRLEKRRDGWELVDLTSKNGTHVGGQSVARHILVDGDVVHIGRTTMTFLAGVFQPPPEGTQTRTLVRPSDPVDALAGTVAGFEYHDPQEPSRNVDKFPQPQPRPREPESYASEDLYTMLTEIASSSWDSIVADASKQKKSERLLPQPKVNRDLMSERLGMPCDLSLQVNETLLAPAPLVTPPMNGLQMALSALVLVLATAVFGASAWILLH
jgi:pSer/pThr/pTyr-binding forkhead associated (FHA) protein